MQHTVSVGIEEITPQMAEDLLSNMIPNRKLNGLRVKNYTAEMSKDIWYDTGDTIKVLSDGRLADGQHRLHAIKRIDKPVKMAVARGINPKAVRAIDTGAKRTAGMQLSIAGYSNAADLSATARQYLMYEANQVSRWGTSDAPTPQELFNFVEDNEETMAHYIGLASHLKKRGFGSNKSSYAAAGLVAYASGLTQEWESFSNGLLDEDAFDDLRSADARRKYGLYLQKVASKSTNKGGEWNAQARVWRALAAFRAYLNDETINFDKAHLESWFKFPMPTFNK